MMRKNGCHKKENTKQEESVSKESYAEENRKGKSRQEIIAKKAMPIKKTSVKKVVKKSAKAVAGKKTAPKVKATRSIAPVMQNAYSPQVIEKKWQAKWEKDKLYRSVIDHSQPKHYALTMLPYPSGDLHIGHWFSMTPSDARARFKRMQIQCDVPDGLRCLWSARRECRDQGWRPSNEAHISKHRADAQANEIHGRDVRLGTRGGFGGSRILQVDGMVLHPVVQDGLGLSQDVRGGLVPALQYNLAREQVWGEDRHCERCGTPVIKKNLEQWFFRATKYADELLNFDGLDWPQTVKTLQTNWIGRSEGALGHLQDCPLLALPHFLRKWGGKGGGDDIEIFTTRPDTLWGTTFMVFAPEHPLVGKVTSPEQKAAVEAYKMQATRQSDIEREAVDKEKTGVFTGGYAINPVNRSAHPDMDCGLRVDELWHRRDHGCPGAR